ncbi:hypothetical protein CTZ28_25425 [Streptomyces shenzhenensis]|uniref:Uncharacterized protein n=1 Tax=Streptomyces shenzhenensis TaxID=943815 RepID=A0A3M0I3K1_9ACTN|nr:hypothetical protein CTZ28_25425 [Streptomyces shenzhenensis]
MASASSLPWAFHSLGTELQVRHLESVQFLGGAVGHLEQKQNPERVEVDLPREQHVMQAAHQADAGPDASFLGELADFRRPVATQGKVVRQCPAVHQTVSGGPDQIRQFQPAVLARVLSGFQELTPLG